VYIGFSNIRDFIIDNKTQVVDINSSCCNIGCHQYPDCLCFEIGQCTLTGILSLISVYGFSTDIILNENPHDLISTVLCPGKYQCVLNGFIP